MKGWVDGRCALGERELSGAREGDGCICHSPHCTLLSPDAEGELQLPLWHPWPYVPKITSP